jgi:hypothetical protein
MSEALTPQLRQRLHAGAVQAVNDRFDRHAARGMRLRVEEHLGVHHVVGGGALQVSPGHVEEVLLLQQHAGAGVVDVQEALQVGEGIGLAQLLDAGVGNAHAVALREREDELGLQRAFDVHVQLGLGHGAQQVGQAVGGDAVEARVVGRSKVGHGGGHLRCDRAQHKASQRARDTRNLTASIGARAMFSIKRTKLLSIIRRSNANRMPCHFTPLPVRPCTPTAASPWQQARFFNRRLPLLLSPFLPPFLLPCPPLPPLPPLPPTASAALPAT